MQTTMYALAAHVYPTAIRATGVGTAVAFGRIGGVLSPSVGSWALESGGAVAALRADRRDDDAGVRRARVRAELTSRASRASTPPARSRRSRPGTDQNSRSQEIGAGDHEIRGDGLLRPSQSGPNDITPPVIRGSRRSEDLSSVLLRLCPPTASVSWSPETMTPQRFHTTLYGQVLIATVIGVLLGHYWPEAGVAMKPLGDGFIKLVRMIIAPGHLLHRRRRHRRRGGHQGRSARPARSR